MTGTVPSNTNRQYVPGYGKVIDPDRLTPEERLSNVETVMMAAMRHQNRVNVKLNGKINGLTGKNKKLEGGMLKMSEELYKFRLAEGTKLKKIELEKLKKKIRWKITPSKVLEGATLFTVLASIGGAFFTGGLSLFGLLLAPVTGGLATGLSDIGDAGPVEEYAMKSWVFKHFPESVVNQEVGKAAVNKYWKRQEIEATFYKAAVHFTEGQDYDGMENTMGHFDIHKGDYKWKAAHVTRVEAYKTWNIPGPFLKYC